MRPSIIIGSLLLVASLSPLRASAQVSSAPDPERAAVQQIIVRFGESLKAGNLTAIEPLFRGGHILTDNGTTHGFAEYRDQHLKAELPRMALGYAHTAVEAVVRGEVAWVAFRRVYSGGATPVEGRGTAVLQKVNNQWLIVHLHMSQ